MRTRCRRAADGVAQRLATVVVVEVAKGNAQSAIDAAGGAQSSLAVLTAEAAGTAGATAAAVAGAGAIRPQAAAVHTADAELGAVEYCADG